ncbi:MAG: aromatic aminobenezylarsenical efflux permease ArsG family transporter [Atribacterota bacterium]|nr:aromatic aminobenezylarsenical efflux permease ArsG family transporter [Atribacterota bacterium]
MEWINSLIDNYNIPILSAFLLGILTSLSPCPLITNITAIAYISREIKTVKHTLVNGIFYTIGRGVSYAALATVIYLGISSFKISSIFQGWGDKVLGPVLILIGLIMLGVFNINIGKGGEKMEKIKTWLSGRGPMGSFFLGMLFALAFCPYSGVLFFGVLIPLVLESRESLFLPLIFALGTGLPVIIFSFLIAFSLEKVGKVFQFAKKLEKVLRYGVALIFLVAGVYYTQFLLKFLFNQ